MLDLEDDLLLSDLASDDADSRSSKEVFNEDMFESEGKEMSE